MMKHKRNKQIPTDKRRIRRTLGYVAETCVEEKIKLDIAKQHKKLWVGPIWINSLGLWFN